MDKNIRIRFELQRGGFLQDYMSVSLDLATGHRFGRIHLTVVTSDQSTTVKLVRDLSSIDKFTNLNLGT